MENTNLSVTFNTEKLDALTYHMGKKDADLQTELQDTVQKLYEKYVPQATRDYIDDRLAREAAEKRKPKRTARPAASGGSSDGPA
jgi:predicted transcriptional regulator YdeE